MLTCPECRREIPSGARFCPECGASQSVLSQAPTAMVSRGSSEVIGASTPSLERSARGTYTAGQVLADRYRIVGLLGRGGMGEVYRADDLKLEQPVSLKFLPERWSSNPPFIAQFHAEVRHARMVAHPNVCRVYDIGEIDGRSFISMEFVDGEDLASLLRRIGRLPKAKADEVARQICLGLAAAHERGVLHRDLKPSNIMLDGEGRVRITDFGLASGPGETGLHEMSGTPAYMAPEQFEGKPATVKSDLYSLGLILYEIYTGKRAFEAKSFAEWKSSHLAATPTSPQSRESDVEDSVERAILRCLEKDPTRRPSSALGLAASLPGGDPLAAALAAGETPSPEMVAAAGGEGSLAPRAAWTRLAGVLFCLGIVLAIAPYSTDLGLAPMTKSAELLKERAKELVAGFGYDAHPVDSDAWLVRLYGPIKELARRKPSPVWRREMKSWGAPVGLQYRQSPKRLVPVDPDGRVELNDPPFETSGSVIARLDAAGHLTLFQAFPPQRDTTLASGAANWDALFGAAALDRATFTETTPQWVPPVAFDARDEWIGRAPWDSTVALRVAAAAWRGRPVYFEVLGPWSRPWRMEREPVVTTRRIAGFAFAAFLLVLLMAAVLFARHNLNFGRGDRRGALRLGIFIYWVGLLNWIASAHHVPDLNQELGLLLPAVGIMVGLSLFLALVYLALEPFLRRSLPELLIGWARVIEGRIRDPRVGRDLLTGALFGTLAAIVFHVGNALPTWIALPGQTTLFPNYDALAGGRLLVAFLATMPVLGLMGGFFYVGLYFLLRFLLRRPMAAAIGLTMIVTLITLGGENPWVETPESVLVGTLAAIVVVRYGLLATVTFSFFLETLTNVPLPLASGAPYLAQSLVILGVLVGLALYAFRISLGSRPVLAVGLEE